MNPIPATPTPPILARGVVGAAMAQKPPAVAQNGYSPARGCGGAGEGLGCLQSRPSCGGDDRRAILDRHPAANRKAADGAGGNVQVVRGETLAVLGDFKDGGDLGLGHLGNPSIRLGQSLAGECTMSATKRTVNGYFCAAADYSQTSRLLRPALHQPRRSAGQATAPHAQSKPPLRPGQSHQQTSGAPGARPSPARRLGHAATCRGRQGQRGGLRGSCVQILPHPLCGCDGAHGIRANRAAPGLGHALIDLDGVNVAIRVVLNVNAGTSGKHQTDKALKLFTVGHLGNPSVPAGLIPSPCQHYVRVIADRQAVNAPTAKFFPSFGGEQLRAGARIQRGFE